MIIPLVAYVSGVKQVVGTCEIYDKDRTRGALDITHPSFMHIFELKDPVNLEFTNINGKLEAVIRF